MRLPWFLRWSDRWWQPRIVEWARLRLERWLLDARDRVVLALVRRYPNTALRALAYPIQASAIDLMARRLPLTCER